MSVKAKDSRTAYGFCFLSILAAGVILAAFSPPAHAFTPLFSAQDGTTFFPSLYHVDDDRSRELRQRRETVRRELMALPPEQRKARMDEIRARIEAERAEKKERYQQAFQQRWDGATTEERAHFCDYARENCEQEEQARAREHFLVCLHERDLCAGIGLGGGFHVRSAMDIQEERYESSDGTEHADFKD